MIPVARGPEPNALKRERRRRLSRAILAKGTGLEVEFVGYDVCKDDLAKALHYKCAFCEMFLRIEGSPVEHFRPKAYVEVSKGEIDRTRYWWLAWTWANLLFACDRCNSSYKRNQFPLVLGATPLGALSEAIETEQALLIDPARIDPMEHIKFEQDPTMNRWVAVPVKQSILGAKTIDLLGLDLDDHATPHVNERVRPSIHQLMFAVGLNIHSLVRVTWDNICNSLFASGQPFHALSRDALVALIPANVFERYGLQFPELGRKERAANYAIFEDPDEFKYLDPELTLSVRALGDAVPWDEMRPVFERLLAVRAWTDDELSRVLDRGAGVIKGYRLRLVSATSAS